MMRRHTLAIILLLALTACQKGQEQDSYKFGAVLPLTGSNSFFGEFAKVGIELAIEDINQNGGINGKPINALFEDSASNKAQANTGAQKLVSLDQVDALFTVTPPMAGVLAPIAETSQVPFIYISATSFSEGKNYAFKDYPDSILSI